MTKVNAIQIKGRLIKTSIILVYDQKINKIWRIDFILCYCSTITNIQNIILNIVFRCYVFYDLGQTHEEQTAAVNIV